MSQKIIQGDFFIDSPLFQYQKENCQQIMAGAPLRKAGIGCLVLFFSVLKLGSTIEKITLYL